MKNLKLFLINCGVILLSVLTLVFLSQGYEKWTLLGKDIYASGYDMIDFGSNDGRADMTALSNILVIVFVSLLIIIAIFNILKDCGVIKIGKKANKVVAFIEVAVAALAVVFTVVALGCVASLVGEMGSAFSVGWALIVNLVISVFIAVFAVASLLGANKRK